MLKHGLATVYEAKTGAEFGGKKAQYQAAEEKAKQARTGMWKENSVWERLMGGGTAPETPRQFKNRMLNEEKNKGSK